MLRLRPHARCAVVWFAKARSRCLLLGIVSTSAIGIAAVSFHLPPDPTGAFTCLVLVAIGALHERARTPDWDLDFWRLLADRLPPPPELRRELPIGHLKKPSRTDPPHRPDPEHRGVPFAHDT